MNLARGIGEECAESTLVQGGEDDAGYGKSQGNPLYGPFPGRKADPFEKAGGDLGDLHREVGGDMPGNQEEHCGRSE